MEPTWTPYLMGIQEGSAHLSISEATFRREFLTGNTPALLPVFVRAVKLYRRDDIEALADRLYEADHGPRLVEERAS